MFHIIRGDVYFFMRPFPVTKVPKSLNRVADAARTPSSSSSSAGQNDCRDPRDSSPGEREDRGDPWIRGTRSDFGGSVLRERYGPHERAGTFEMAAANAVRVPESKILVEFAVWRKAASKGGVAAGRVLWFKARKEMAPAAATAVRALEVWTDRDNRYPSKVVVLLE